LKSVYFPCRVFQLLSFIRSVNPVMESDTFKAIIFAASHEDGISSAARRS